MSRVSQEIAQKRLQSLLQTCGKPGRVLILTQDNPDPDALASAAALKQLLKTNLKKNAHIRYGGSFSRAENTAMVRLLNIKAERIDPRALQKYQTICLVDTQPGSAINILPAERQADVVIDHHNNFAKRIWNATFADVRPNYGANTSILYEYIEAAAMPLSANLATAMFYGIQSDTQDLGREASAADVYAYRELFLYTDKRKLAQIHRAPVPAEYFRTLADSLSNVVTAGTTVVSCIQACHNIEIIAEVADLLLRMEGMKAAVCYGVCGDKIHLSVRTSSTGSNAGEKMRRLIKRIGSGGGHKMMAGGQVPVGDQLEATLAMVRDRILRVFAPGKPVIRLTNPDENGPCLGAP